MSDRLELKVVFSAVDKFLRPVNAITKGAKEASQALKLNTDRIAELNSTVAKIDAFKKVERDSAIAANSVKSTAAKLAELRAEIAKAGAPTDAQASKLAELKAKSETLALTTDKLRRHEIDLTAALKQAGVDTKSLSTAREHLVAASSSELTMSRKLQAALDAENKKMQRLKTAQADLAKSKELSGKLAGAGAGMMAGGAAMSAASSVPVMAYAKAEDAATQLQVALMRSNGEVEESYKRINDLANQLGNKLPGTTADYQNMMTMLVRQGMSSKAILGGLGEATALLGVQLKMPMEAAADFASKLQDATRTTEKDMLGLMDVIQRTFYLGVDQNNMLEAFKGLGPVMDMIKVKGLEGTKALTPFVVMMDQAGMRGESAGNAIRKVISRSMDVDGIKDMQDGLKVSKGIDLNLDFTDGKGEFGGIDKLMSELTKLKKFDTVTRLSILKDIYGDDKETNEVLSKIIEQGKDGYNEVIAKMQAQADLKGRVDQQLNTLNNLWDAASGTFTNALVAFGESIAPELHATARLMGTVTTAVQAWAKENPTLAAGLMTVVKYLALGLTVIGGIALAASAILGPLAMAQFAMTTLGISASGLAAGAFNLVMKGIGGVGSSLMWLGRMAMTHPILALIALIAAGAIYIWQNWDTLGPKFFALVEKITGYFGGLKDRAIEIGGQMIDGMIGGITSRWEALKATVVGVAEASIDWIKEKLGIHSPSRVFAELGGFTMQGLEQGIAGGEDGPLDAVGAMAKKLAGIGAGIAIGGAAMAGDLASSPGSSVGTAASGDAGGGNTYYITIQSAHGADNQNLATLVAREIERIESRRAAQQRSRLRDSE